MSEDKSQNLFLRKDIYKFFIEKHEKIRQSPDDKFGTYMNNLLEKCMNMILLYGEENIFARLHEDSRLMLKFLDVSERLRTENELLKNYVRS